MVVENLLVSVGIVFPQGERVVYLHQEGGIVDLPRMIEAFQRQLKKTKKTLTCEDSLVLIMDQWAKGNATQVIETSQVLSSVGQWIKGEAIQAVEISLKADLKFWFDLHGYSVTTTYKNKRMTMPMPIWWNLPAKSGLKEGTFVGDRLYMMSSPLYHYEGGVRMSGPSPQMVGDCSGLYGDCSGLHGDCTDIAGDCSDLIGDCTELSSDYIDGLSGDCTGLVGNLSSKSGDCTGLIGDCTGMKGCLSGVTGDCTKIVGLVGIDGDVTGLSGDVTGLWGNITGLTGDATGLWGDATGLLGDCVDLWRTERESPEGTPLLRVDGQVFEIGAGRLEGNSNPIPGLQLGPWPDFWSQESKEAQYLKIGGQIWCVGDGELYRLSENA